MFYFIAGLALIAIGVVMLVKPQLVFELTESRRYRPARTSRRQTAWKRATALTALPRPVILIPGKEGSLGLGMANIKKSVERAVGADIL